MLQGRQALGRVPALASCCDVLVLLHFMCALDVSVVGVFLLHQC